MNTSVYVIKDTLADEIGPMFEAKNHEIAKRQFRNLLKEVSDKSDYKLYCIGHFDREFMELTPEINVEVIVNVNI